MGIAQELTGTTLVDYEVTSALEDPVTYEIEDWSHTTGAPRRLGLDLLLIPNAVPDLMDQLVEAADKLHKWQAPTVVRGQKVEQDYSFRKCETLAICARVHRSLRPFEAITKGLCGLWAAIYKCHVNPHMAINGVEEQVQLLRYWPGMFFNEHVDAVHNNPALVGRRLSILYFRGSEDCEGGALVYRRQGYAIYPDGRVYKFLRRTPMATKEECEGIETSDKWRLIMPASKGTLLIMPSDPCFPHWKQPITAGSAETLVKWCH